MAGAGPIEWVRGRSTLPWFALFMLTSTAVLEACQVVWILLFGSLLVWAQFNVYFLFVLVEGLGIGIAGFVFQSVNPFPIALLGLLPKGVIIDFGLRRIEVPESRLHLVGTRLFALSKRFGIASAYSLTPYQASRLRQVLRGAAS